MSVGENPTQFAGLKNLNGTPESITTVHLQDFLEYINGLGMTAYSQARILSGLKSFFKYLRFEEIITLEPTALIESPRLGRKLPDTLSYLEIVTILDSIDLSTPAGGRNRAML